MTNGGNNYVDKDGQGSKSDINDIKYRKNYDAKNNANRTLTTTKTAEIITTMEIIISINISDDNNGKKKIMKVTKFRIDREDMFC